MITFVFLVLWASYRTELPALSVVVVSIAVFGITAALYVRNWKPIYCGIVGCLLAVLVVTFHARALQLRQLPDACIGQLEQVVGQVVSLPERSPGTFGGTRTTFELIPLTSASAQASFFEPGSACEGPRRLLLSYYGDAVIEYGQVWRFVAKLKQPRGLSNPGLFDREVYYVQEGIDALGSVKGDGERIPTWPPPRALRIDTLSLSDSLQRIRQRLGERIALLPFDEDVRGSLRALVLADKNGIDAAFWERISALGINHLFVVSGLHVGFMAGLGFLVGRALAAGLAVLWQRAHYLPAVLALLFAAVYVGLAGFTLPTQRAFLMLLIFVLGMQLGRPQPGAVRLLAAAAVVLLLSPLAGLGAGFWLSFGAVAALLWLSLWQSQLPWWRQFSATHAYMMLVMLPLGGYFFGGASVVAAFANAVMVPVVGMVVVPLALCAAAAHVLQWWIEWPLWIGAGVVVEVMLVGVEWVADAGQGALFRHNSGSTVAVLLGVAACLVVVLPVGRRSQLVMLLVLLPLFMPLWSARSVLSAHPASPKEGTASATRVTVLDVGQGTAVVVQRARRALVFDTGGGTPGGYTLAQAVLVPYLRRQGVAALDTLVISHGDADHSAGWRDITTQLPVSRLRHGPDQHLPLGRRCRAGESWQWPGGVRFQFLSPSPGRRMSNNDGSCVLQIKTGNRTLLLTGDIGGQQERNLVRYWRDALASDWLLVAHHGSRTSTYWSFLKHVNPSIAVITAGYANRFGHPHPDIVARLEKHGVQTFNTALTGAVTFEISDTGNIDVVEHRQATRRHWM